MVITIESLSKMFSHPQPHKHTAETLDEDHFEN